MRLLSVLLALVALACPAVARADVAPSALCRSAITAAEHAFGIPDRLMLAIGVVESGRPDPAGGAPQPWPWSIDAGGQDYVLATLPEAVAVAGFLQQLGLASLDVGCFQVNLRYHPGAFATLAQGFDAAANADYAAAFLRRLYTQTGSWLGAVAAYHSADATLGQAYLARVQQAWQRLGPTVPLPVASGRAGDPHVIMASAAAALIPVYSPATLPSKLRAALGLR